MTEEDIIKELFRNTDLTYPLPEFEESVIKKIKRIEAYKKQKQNYNRLGKIGFAIFISLSFLFILLVCGVAAQKTFNTTYMLIAMSSILVISIIQLELINSSNPKKQTLL